MCVMGVERVCSKGMCVMGVVRVCVERVCVERVCVSLGHIVGCMCY